MQYQTKMPPQHAQKEYAKLCEIYIILDGVNRALDFRPDLGYKVVPVKFLKTYKLYKDTGDKSSVLIDEITLDQMLDLVRTVFPHN